MTTKEQLEVKFLRALARIDMKHYRARTGIEERKALQGETRNSAEVAEAQQ